MLVLTRKAQEAIRIGEEVEVRVLEIGEGYVRLGIAAPRAIAVHREEVYLAIHEANRRAAATLPLAVALAERTLSPGRRGQCGHVPPAHAQDSGKPSDNAGRYPEALPGEEGGVPA